MNLQRWLSALLFAGVLAFTGRAESTPTADSLAESWKKWLADRPDQYSYIYESRCYCAPKSWNVEAVGDSVVRVSIHRHFEDTVWPSHNLQYFSIDSVFARIESALGTQPARTIITYDKGYGFPVEAYIDPDARTADEEYTYSITEFKPITVTMRPVALAARWPAAGLRYDIKGRPAPGRVAARAVILTR